MSIVFFEAENPPRPDLLTMSQIAEKYLMNRSMTRRMATKLAEEGYDVYRLRDPSKSEAWNNKFSTVFYSESDILSLKTSSNTTTLRPPVAMASQPPLTTTQPPATTTPSQPQSIWDDAALNKIEDLYGRLLDEKEDKIGEIKQRMSEYERLLDEKEAKVEKIEGAFARERNALERVIAGLTNELSYFKNRAIKMERLAERAEKEVKLLTEQAAGDLKVPTQKEERNIHLEGVQAPTPW